MIGILDEVLRESRGGPYLEMPDYMMKECIMGKWTSVGPTSRGQTYPYPFHTPYFHRVRKRKIFGGFSASSMHL